MYKTAEAIIAHENWVRLLPGLRDVGCIASFGYSEGRAESLVTGKTRVVYRRDDGLPAGSMLAAG